MNDASNPAAHGTRLPGSAVGLAALLVLCLATRVYFLYAVPLCAEDAYITFRYAVHWAQGLGPAYNPGELAWGFTSPLWTAYLALASFAGAPVEHAARITLLGCDLASLVLAFRLLAPHSVAGAAGLGLFFAAWPRFAHLPATGLETSLVTCLMLAAASFARSRFGGALNGLLALSRPEGAAMSVLLAWRLTPRQRAVWLAFAALLVPFMLHFGRLLPSSVGSKASVYGIRWFESAYWLEWLIPGMEPRTADGAGLAPVSIVLLAGLVAILARWRRGVPDAPALATLVAGGLLQLLGYAALGVPWFFWYSPTPMLAILCGVFLGLATTGLLRWLLVPLVVFLAFSWTTVAPRVVRLQTLDAAVFENIGRTLRTDAAGSAGERAAIEPASVLLEPIGIIGFTSGLRVIDEVGLVTPWVAAERLRGDGWYARVIAKDPPDYIVIRRDWLEGGVAWSGVGAPFASADQAARTLADYQPLRHRHGGRITEGAGRLQILKRRR